MQSSTRFEAFIDHTLLKADATVADIRGLCLEAKKYGFYSVCVNPANVRLCKNILSGSGVKVCTVAGFPLGASAAVTKAFEAKTAAKEGADEIDMVINVGALKSGRTGLVLDEIKLVRAAVPGKVLKVIIEAALLSRKEKILACRLAKKAGADLVKTSTGFASGGASVPDVRLLRGAAGSRLGVKAAGGIRDAKTFLKMIKAGASRVGTSNSVSIMREIRGAKNECK